MATYYVRPGGTGNGTGPALNQAWGTFQAPFTSGSGVIGGDTVYIAPGHYNEKVTVTITSPTSTLSIIGDVTGSQFSGVAAGPVRLSGFSSAGNAVANLTAPQFSATSKNYLSFSNIIFEGSPTGATGSNLVRFITSTNITFTKCLFVNETYATTATEGTLLHMSAPSSGAANHAISKCIFVVSGRTSVIIGGNNVADTTSISDCIFQGGTAEGVYLANVQVSIRNCTFIGNTYQALIMAGGSASFFTTIRNCLFLFNIVAINASSANTTEDYNRFTSNATNRSGTIATGANSSSVGASRLDYGYSRIAGLNPIDFYGPQQGSPNQGFGISSGAEATDVMSIAWTGATPDAGYQTYSTVATLSPTYNPTERNASTITIAPGSTSQSIELYLGATGLTASTSGLSARYNRTRTASVSIPLVARTIGQAWTAGGFAEVDATNMPGVYRLDLPDAALAAGADDVTVVVRGAAGTNGAVMTIKLSSGGLSSTETAQAVWNATASSYNTAGSMGEAGQRLTGYSLASSQTFSTTGSVGSVTSPVTVGTNNDKTGYSLSTSQTFNTTGSVGSVTGAVGSVTGSVGSVTGSVGSVTGAVGSVTSAVTVGTNNDKSGYSLSSAGNTSAAGAVWNSARSTYTSAGTFGQYVNAELVTPVSQGSLVYMGPYQVIADGVTTPQPLDIQKGAVTGIGIQLVDNNLSGISITGATVTTKVYNAGGSLVDTYSCTATYAADGRATFTIDTTVTDTPGTYTATITRTTGASDTQVFGPLRIYVRDI